MGVEPTSSLKTSTPTIAGSEKSKFPNCSKILWDKRCVGTEIETSFSYFRDISLSVVERVLRLAYQEAISNFKSTKNPLFRGFFVGNLSSHDIDDEIKIIVNRFDSGIHVNPKRNDSMWPTITSKLQDDVVIPVLMANRREINDASELVDDVFARFVKEIEENLSCSLDNLMILKLFKCLCICQYTDQFGELSFDLSWNLVAPSTSFLLRPLNPVPIIPTALARNLSGPLSLSSLQNAPKHGFLTMDQTRKILLLLESDPKISSLPLVGAWVSGVVSACDISVWASLIRYCHSRKLANKQLGGTDGFLLMCYSRTDKMPSFFDCCTQHSSIPYKLFQSHEELNLFPESNRKSDTTFVYFPLSLTEMSPIHQVLDVALRTLKNSSPDKCLLRFEDELSSIIACSPPEEPSPCPQLVPSPHFSNHLKSVDSVPEVSVWEPEVRPDNNSGSGENDLGFFSKSSSDHDSSTDRMYNFPSRQILSAPLHTIESSENIGDSSLVRSTDGEAANPTLFCRSEGNRSVLGLSDCHSCKSEKSQMVLNLQQQKKQLEMLQNQIQTLLKAQNISFPDNFVGNVSTKSAQTSPAASSNISMKNENYCGPEMPSSLHASSLESKISRSISVVDETLISIDPNSVALQEDTQSHDNVVISHVDMPSFAETEMNETSLTAADKLPVSTFQTTNSIALGIGQYDAGSMDLQVLNCLNSSQIGVENIPESSDSPKKYYLQKLQAQVATALSINSTETAHSQSNEMVQLTSSIEQMKNEIDDSVLSSTVVPTLNHPILATNFNYSDRMRSVDLSLEANAIAMRYGAKLDVDDLKRDLGGFEGVPINLFTEPTNVRHFNTNSDHRYPDVSFATERYLQRHGILHNSIIIEESICQSSIKSDRNLNSTRKTNASPSGIQAICSSSPKNRAASEREGSFSPKEAANKRRVEVSKPKVCNDFLSDEEDNILDIEKLRALPKLL